MFGLFQHGMGPLANFQADYKVYPISFIDKPDAENGDKVFMPPSALHRLCAHLPASGPLPGSETSSHARITTHVVHDCKIYPSAHNEEQTAVSRAVIGACEAHVLVGPHVMVQLHALQHPSLVCNAC